MGVIFITVSWRMALGPPQLFYFTSPVDTNDTFFRTAVSCSVTWITIDDIYYIPVNTTLFSADGVAVWDLRQVSMKYVLALHTNNLCFLLWYLLMQVAWLAVFLNKIRLNLNINLYLMVKSANTRSITSSPVNFIFTWCSGIGYRYHSPQCSTKWHFQTYT
jgi:hypothetical protein